MLALYRCGRQTEALERYRTAREALADNFGLEPGPELQELEHAILVQDPDIAAPRRTIVATLSTRHGRGGALILAGGMLLLAAAVGALVVIVADGGTAEAEPPANSLALIDPDSASLMATLPTGVQPTDVASTEENVWVANAGDDTVTQGRPGDQDGGRHAVSRRRASPDWPRRRRRLDRRCTRPECRAARPGARNRRLTFAVGPQCGRRIARRRLWTRSPPAMAPSGW